MSVVAPDYTSDELAAERWVAIPGWEGTYEVSDLGRVRSLDRERVFVRRGAVTRQRMPGRMLTPAASSSGYPMVALGPQTRTTAVHILVLRAFVGPPAPGQECLHGDGVRTNPRLANLRWGTRSENMQDALRHGTVRNGNTKLTAEDVAAIRAALPTARTSVLARRYGVSPSTICDIRAGRIWRGLPAESEAA